ncbi:acyl-CoA-binding protein [Gregarina niphandrodes]|uniref:Acyl-CoA-binding protein n=1 Tax=Gregarina niphandrodes TaxID=110365 RepID=A0A023B8A7_GRENI|nr:acyl-CoA-binding protein [Gregarina niphandrodes]EZG68890.1 acyl-CoA-binding protein [Gregarina niphandrodes]|eukprot:XP_011134535.1 acyl-CoA-binding protein [Gregarina niphandrodes]
MSFDAAAAFIRRTDTGISPSQAEQLELYSLYKQATEGDAQGSRPSIVNPTARAKWDAWNERKGMDKTKAAEEYINTVAKICPGWQSK